MKSLRMAVLAGLTSLGLLSGCCGIWPHAPMTSCCPTELGCCPTGTPCSGPILEDPGRFQTIPSNGINGIPGFQQPIMPPPQSGLPPLAAPPTRLVPQAIPVPAEPTARTR